jgi:hypothetical protein
VDGGLNVGKPKVAAVGAGVSVVKPPILVVVASDDPLEKLEAPDETSDEAPEELLATELPESPVDAALLLVLAVEGLSEPVELLDAELLLEDPEDCELAAEEDENEGENEGEDESQDEDEGEDEDGDLVIPVPSGTEEDLYGPVLSGTDDEFWLIPELTSNEED